MNKEELKQETTALVEAFLDGDNQAFNRLVLLYQTKIYHLALNYVKTQEEAQDLAQDVFITVYKALPKLREKEKFSSADGAAELPLQNTSTWSPKRCTLP